MENYSEDREEEEEEGEEKGCRGVLIDVKISFLYLLIVGLLN